jgi:hypothetical protein
MSRVAYIVQRILETPPHALARKMWLRLKPHLYVVSYTIGRASDARMAPDRIAAVVARLAELPRRDGEANDPDYERRVASRAAMVLAGRFPVLGYGEAEIPSGSGWRRYPFHDSAWPSKFFPNVNFLAGAAHADVKIPWELSRLQFLVWLAEQAALNGGAAQACIARFERILEDWVEANPVGFGVNWTCGMEVAIRSVNLVFAGALIAGRLSPVCQSRLVRTLVDHLTFLRRFPEYSDVTGNHYLACLMGVAVLESVISGTRSDAFARSVAAFLAEADRQFEASGAHLEYATVYHRLCMDMLAIVHALATQAGDVIANPVASVLERAMGFADMVASPGGLLPIFGDSDSGHVLWFGAEARRLDAMRAYCHGVPPGGLQHDLALLLARFRCDSAALFPARRFEAGVSGPFLAMRSEAMTVVVRHGPQGLKGRAPHDHDDALSFWVFLGDEDLFVDIGCLGYTLDPLDRQATIVSSGHAVWSPVGSERFSPVEGSIFVTVRGAPDAKVELEQEDHGLTCKLELRGALGRSLAEERRIVLLSDMLRIEDRILLREPEQMEMMLRLGPAFSPSRTGEMIEISSSSGSGVGALRFEANTTLAVSLTSAIWAPQFARKETISAVRVRSAHATEHLISWTLGWADKETPRNPRNRSIATAEDVAIGARAVPTREVP